MVIGRLLLALIISLLPLAASSAQLLLNIDKQEVQLGHAIKAELLGIDLPQDISSLDLTPLRTNFGIVTEETIGSLEDARWPGQSIQKMVLRLYPRRVGELTIPALHAGEIQSIEKSIRSLEGIQKQATGNLAISQRIHVSTQAPWERQQVIVSVEIQTPDTFATLQTEDKPKIPGFAVFPLPLVKTSHGGTTRLRISWALFPLTEGNLQLELPPVEYRKSGRTQRLYFLPIQQIAVRPLPAYIPPTMPVGKLSITSRLNQEGLLHTDRLVYWTIALTGTGMPPQWMPSVSVQIQGNASLRFSPASKQKNLFAEEDGLRSEVSTQIPVTILKNGGVDLPLLQLQYFDPETGRIRNISHRPHEHYALSARWRTALIGLTLLAGLSLLGYGLYRVIGNLKRKQERRRIIQVIKASPDIVTLRHSLKQVAELEGWQSNISIQRWLSLWEKRFRSGQGMRDLMNELSKACYRPDGSDQANAYRDSLVRHLRQAWGV